MSILCAPLACYAPAPEAAPQPFQNPAPFSASSIEGTAEEVAPQARWWRAFDDPALEARIDDALAGSYTLAAALERLRAAEALIARSDAERLPSVDAFLEGEKRDGEPGGHVRSFGAGLEASFELDLWGRVAAQTEAAELRAATTAADRDAAAISLSAAVALAWYELAEARLQHQLVEAQIETNTLVLDVLELRFSIGQSDSTDVLRQRQLVEARREQAHVQKARIDVLEHVLATLAGHEPQAAHYPDARALPDLPAPPASGLPSELLARRPDVRAAWLAVAAAEADVVVADRDRYPRFNLGAALSTSASEPDDLFDDWLARLTAQVVAPLVDGGARAAELERTVALRRESVAVYGATVLTALREVEDALALEAAVALRLTSLRAQLELAASTERQLRTQYLNGTADFIDMLTALRDKQNLERSLLATRFEQIAQRIALHRALAGSFPLEPTSTAP